MAFSGTFGIGAEKALPAAMAVKIDEPRAEEKIGGVQDFSLG